MPQHPAPGPDVPPAADASGTITTQTGQSAPAAPAGPPAGLADAQARPWLRALLTCGHRVDVAQQTPGPATAPTSVPCPRCGVHRPVDVYPLTALSDPDNVGWVEETDQ